MALTATDIARHNQLHDAACKLVRRDILVDGQPLSPLPGFFARLRLRKATRMFDEVLRLNPQNWVAVWMVGKIHHRLGDRERALDWMLKAHRGDPSIAGFAREADFVASQLGRHQEGIDLTELAIRLRPDDGSLYSNLGLMQLLNGAVPESIRSFGKATELEPGHPMTPRLLSIATAVREGAMPCPKTEQELLKVLSRVR